MEVGNDVVSSEENRKPEVDDDDQGGVGQVHHEGASGLHEVRRANDFRGGPVLEGKK